MNSYRVSLAVGVLSSTTNPQDIVPLAVATAKESVVVEHSDIGIVRGQARIIIRILAEHDLEAMLVATDIERAVSQVAAVTDPQVTRRYGNTWHRVRRTIEIAGN